MVAGYATAALLSMGIVALHVAATNTPERNASSGMYAFGDLLFFMAAFGSMSTVPTALALYFLRGVRALWVLLCGAAAAIAPTALAAIVLIALPYQTTKALGLDLYSSLSVPRLFATPFVGAAFLLGAALAPERPFRIILGVATALEGIGALYAFFHWFAPLILDRLR